MDRTDYQHAEDFKAAASTSHTQAVVRQIARIEKERDDLDRRLKAIETGVGADGFDDETIARMHAQQKRIDELLADNTRLELRRREETERADAARYTLKEVEYSRDQWRRICMTAEHMFTGETGNLDCPEGCTKDNNIVSLCFRSLLTIQRLREELGFKP